MTGSYLEAEPRLLFVIDSLEIGGSEKSLVEILAHRQQTETIVCHIYPGASLRGELESIGVKVENLEVTAKYGFFSAIRRLTKLVEALNPDLICTVLTRADIVGRVTGRLTSTPVLSSLVNQSYSVQRFQRLSAGLRSKLTVVWLLDRLTARYAKHFVANSEAVKDSACRTLGIHSSKVTVIPRGRDPNEFSYKVSKRHVAGQTVINVGRLTAAKGHSDLIKAMRRIREAMPYARLRIVGEGPQRSSLMKRIRELDLEGCVTLLGSRNDVPELLADADVFAFPSYWEGHPGALVEAMFSGLPIVATDIQPHRETLRHRTTGVLVPSGDVEALADAVLQLLADPAAARTMGERARAEAVSRYAIADIAAAHEELWHRLIEG